MKSCGPFITNRAFPFRLQIHVSHKLIFFCLLSTQNLLEPKQWILMLKLNFVVAYSNVYFSIHIVIIQEMSSFVNQFFNLSSLTCWTGFYTSAGQSKTGRENSEISQISLTQPFGSVSKLIFSEIKSTLLQNKRKRWFLDAYFMKPFRN